MLYVSLIFLSNKKPKVIDSFRLSCEISLLWGIRFRECPLMDELGALSTLETLL